MGLCVSKDEKANGKLKSGGLPKKGGSLSGTKSGNDGRGRKGKQKVRNQQQQQVGDGQYERDAIHTTDTQLMYDGDTDVKPDVSPSQSTSITTGGDRKKSVVSAMSRQTATTATSANQSYFGSSSANTNSVVCPNRALKVLLLGSGDSGKSTILQQLKILHQNGFTDEELLEYKPFIFDNLAETGRDLVSARLKFGVPLEQDSDLTEDDLDQLLHFVRPSSPSDNYPRDLAIKLAKLWQLKSTRDLLSSENRSKFYLMDNAGYFVENLDRISQPGYQPNVTDILCARKKTSGVFDTHIEMDGTLKLHIYDVGGQRSERKKWIYCFDNVTLIIFCVSLSEYDQTLMEDNTQNRLEESLILFDSVVNSRWFTRTSVVLFLNKIDAFAEKIKTVPLEKYFPDYTGGPDIHKAAKYILWRFVQLNRANLNIYPHVTQATDTSNIRLVFAAIKETILENSLKDSGVL